MVLVGKMTDMREIWLPTVPYQVTARRPEWVDLPVEVRAGIEIRLAGPVTHAEVARGGFTTGFAAVLTSAHGERAFVKASAEDYLVEAYGREAVVTAALPAGVPAARPRWTATAAGWFILCLDAVDGHMPGLPWDPAELDAALAAWATATEALRDPGCLGLGLADFAAVARDELTTWREIAAHRAPLPAMPRYALAHLDELAALEARLAELAAGPPGLMHCDLRLDNVLIARDGTARLCDWNWVCQGPAWFDTMALLVTAYASGLDADGLFAGHPTAAGTPPDALDAGLATLGGLWLTRASQPSAVSPNLTAHQRWSGEVALAWLADRRRWPDAGRGGHSDRRPATGPGDGRTRPPVLAPPTRTW